MCHHDFHPLRVAVRRHHARTNGSAERSHNERQISFPDSYPTAMASCLHPERRGGGALHTDLCLPAPASLSNGQPNATPRANADALQLRINRQQQTRYHSLLPCCKTQTPTSPAHSSLLLVLLFFFIENSLSYSTQQAVRLPALKIVVLHAFVRPILATGCNFAKR